MNKGLEKLRKSTLPLLSILLLISLSSCDVAPQQANGSQPPEVKEVVEKLPLNLPCFGCHPYENFKDPKLFPHDMHKEMGLHCNQCHIIKSHESMSLNGATCNNCHNLTHMNLSLTAMPVMFTHGNHSNMFGCSDCHKKTFRMKLNSVKMTMESIYKGKYCGKCHNGKIAFSSTNCDRCHQQGS